MRATCRFCRPTFIGPWPESCGQAMADHTWACDAAQDFIRAAGLVVAARS